jgi:heptosyltransferase-1
VIVPRLDLQQLASLLAESKGVIGVDTGPVHLAVALGCKTVALYTDTEPGMTGVAPVRKSDSINLGGAGQSPSSDQVMDAARRLGIV